MALLVAPHFWTNACSEWLVESNFVGGFNFLKKNPNAHLLESHGLHPCAPWVWCFCPQVSRYSYWCAMRKGCAQIDVAGFFPLPTPAALDGVMKCRKLQFWVSPDGSTSAGIKLCKRRTGEALWVDGRCEADAVLEEDCFEKRRAGQLGFAMSTNPWESILHSVYLYNLYIYIYYAYDDYT